MSDDQIEITSGGRTYRLDLKSEELFREKQERVRLTEQQWALLRHFVENNSRLIKKEELRSKLWANVPIGDEAISQAIRSLRTALNDRQAKLFIRTEHRRGYRFVGDVKRVKSEKFELVDAANVDDAPSALTEAPVKQDEYPKAEKSLMEQRAEKVKTFNFKLHEAFKMNYNLEALNILSESEQEKVWRESNIEQLENFNSTYKLYTMYRLYLSESRRDRIDRKRTMLTRPILNF